MALPARNFSDALPHLSGYSIVEQLYVGAQTIVYRAVEHCSQHLVIIKLLQQGHPSFNDLLQFHNQYTITKNLNIPGSIHPYSLEFCGNSYALVMEDFGGVSLRHYVQEHSLGLPEIVAIALQLAETLHHLHQARIIHKNIKPSNILIHPESQQVKLIDFSIASLLPQASQEIKNFNRLEGSLAYLSPEQTGRMNRGIDYRADFYALGVTLFELFTGQLPFQSFDPMELVHCHLAKHPPRVHHLRPEIPVVLSDIVDKLMAKNAEARYQSSLGLQHDLQTCLSQLAEAGQIAPFAIASQDICDRFLIPEKLYGREAQVQKLLAAFGRVSQGSCELVLVGGYSGVGKTALVNEILRQLTRSKGYFTSGKFDQFQQNSPLAALLKCYHGLIRHLLTESEDQLHYWRDRFLAHLGANAQLIVDAIPDLELIIGQQSPVPELGAIESANRLRRVLDQFAQALQSPHHPIVFFMDDAQWADTTSIQSLQAFMQNPANHHWLMVIAYRDHKIGLTHPFMQAIQAIRQAGVAITELKLEPLGLEHVTQLVSETLHQSAESVAPLANLLFEKTAGNPFFLTQLFKSLHEDELIRFDTTPANRGTWQWDLAQIQQREITDNVVELMIGKISKLSKSTQQMLQLVACIGNSFDLQTVATVSDRSYTQVARDLWEAIQTGLIVPTETGDRRLPHLLNTDQIANSLAQGQAIAYRFSHDRVQQAAYSLISEAQKKITHHRIGQRLLKTSSEIEREERIFEIVNQINSAVELIAQPREQEELALLNLMAGRKAKNSNAYSAAVQYFAVGRNLLASDCWVSQYDLALALYVEATEAAYLNTDAAQMASLAEVVLHRARTAVDKVKIYVITIDLHTSEGQFFTAITTGLKALKQLEIDLPESPTLEDVARASQSIRNLLGNRKSAELLNQPDMTNPQMLAALQIVHALSVPGYLAKPNLHALTIMTLMRLSIVYGNAPSSALVYSSYGLFLSGAAGEIERAYEFSQLALNLLLKLKTKKIESRVLFITTAFIIHWKIPVRDTLPLLRSAYSSGWENGGLMELGYAAYVYGFHAYLAGYDLPQLEQEIAAYSKALERISQRTQRNYNELYRQMILNLLGQTANSVLLLGDVEQEQAILTRHQQANDQTGLWHFFFIKLTLSYLFQEFEQALAYIEQGERHASGGRGMFNVPSFYFYASLTLLAIAPSQPKPAQDQSLKQVAANQQNMQVWATHAPTNHLHKYYLVEAERHQVLGDRMAAIEHYDLAIAQAQENKFIQDEALANELAAKFYLNWGKEKVATGYMQDAYYCYAHWGAKAKIADLERCYPNLLRPILQQVEHPLNVLETLTNMANRRTETVVPLPLSIYASPDQTSPDQTSPDQSRSFSPSINAVLDFATILKASQSLASTIQLDELLRQLTQIILQNSGSDRCALILCNYAGEWRIEAIATPEATELCSTPLDDNATVPVKLIQYVKNTQDVVVIDDLKTDLPVIDHYLIQQQPKSVLSLPILNQGKLLGILYLENQSISDVFTSDRILILNFLCAQAAISLENAHLYQASQTYARQLEQSLEKLRVSETRFQKLADNVPGLIYRIRIKADGSASTPYVSSGSQTLYEVAAEDLMSGKYSLRDFEHPDDQAEVLQAVLESLQNRTTFQFEWRIITPSGTVKWVKAASQPEFRDDVDTVWDGILIDITDRKQAEAAVLQQSQKLERALTDLQNAQLQMVQHEKMASLGNLVAGIAHEINNPIGFLNGSILNAEEYMQALFDHLELYQRYHPDAAAPIQKNAEDIDLEFLRADLPKLVDSMKGATDRIKTISTGLRTFSRADTEHKVSINLHEGLDSTLLILKYRLKANQDRPAIQVIQAYGELPPIMCFPGQINQVFMNILANAIDVFDEAAQQSSFDELEANPQKITIQTTAFTKQDVVEICIRDNGRGMAEDVKTRVFDHLFTTKAVDKGTGLGLAIAHQIVTENHRGSLNVQSELDHGTEFCIRLPISGQVDG